MPTISRTKESRNGTRQPHARKASCGRAEKAPITTVPSTEPVGAPALTKDAANPRLLGSECSRAISAAPPHSPPTAMPWQTLNSTRITAPQGPMTLAPGIRPINVDAIPIMAIETMSMPFRPILSPKWPKITPPKGRAT
jgi:hypothetical protein